MSRNMKRVWVVRSGKHGDQEQFSLDNNCIAVGGPAFPESPNLTGMTPKEVKAHLTQKKVGASQVNQLLAFRDEPLKGELVILPLRDGIASTHMAVGEIRGDYEYHEDGKGGGTAHRRPVAWLNKRLRKNLLPLDILKSLASPRKIFTLEPTDADERTRNALLGVKGADKQASTPALDDTTAQQGKKEVWVVRAGKDREQFSLDNNCIAIGWPQLPDLNGLDRDDVESFVTKYPERTKLKPGPFAILQPLRFRDQPKNGELIIVPSKIDSSYIAIGEIRGDYSYHPEGVDNCTQHRRPVKWLNKAFHRDDLPDDLKRPIAAWQNLFTLTSENADARIRALLNVKGPTPRSNESAPEGTPHESHEDLEVYENLQERAHDLIREHIGRQFPGHDLQLLVGALLETTGFTCHVPGPGADHGIDILAADKSGLGETNICVQVKNTKEPVGEAPLRDLIGTMDTARANKGIFVSWGGFRRNRDKLQTKHFFKIRLWNADDVIEMIQEHYDDLPDDIKDRLRLKKIWILDPPKEDQ